MKKKLLALLLTFCFLLGTAIPTWAAQGDTAIAGQSNVISASRMNSAAILSDGSLWVWGAAGSGETGQGTPNTGNFIWTDRNGNVLTAYQTVPLKLMDDVITVCLREGRSLAVKADHTLWTWGGSDPSTTEPSNMRAKPYKIADDVIAATSANHLTAIIKSDNSLWMQGRNNGGQFGNGTYADTHKESDDFVKCMDDVAVFCVETESYVGTDAWQEAVVKTDGTLWVWGGHVPESLRPLPEDYSIYDKVRPTKVMDDAVSVACGDMCIYIIKKDGSLWSAGSVNDFGQLGTGATEVPTEPVKILEDVRSVCAYSHSAAAVKNDGSLWVWGQDKGEGDILTTPTKVMDDVVSVSLGQGHVLVAKKDGTLWGWGNNTAGQLGNDRFGNDYSKDEYGSIRTVRQTTPVKILDGVMLPTDEAVSPVPPSQADPQDNEPSSWAAESVRYAVDFGLVPESLQRGYTEPATRAEFCALAVTLYEMVKGTITAHSSFLDTDDPNVEKMAALGVVNGVGNGRFDPEAKLTREQAATMLARLATVMGYPIPERETESNDRERISSWAIAAVGQMQESGIMNGTGSNLFAPDGNYTREQCIITVLRLLRYCGI